MGGGRELGTSSFLPFLFMANPTPTLRKVLQNCAPDDDVVINGIKWRAETLLHLLIMGNDARLSENCIEDSNGNLTLYAAGMGAVDATTPAMKANSHSHKNNSYLL